MKKRLILITVLLLMAYSLSGCGLLNAAVSLIAPDPTEATVLPLRMVKRIDVTLTPNEEGFERHYETLENMNSILRMLRELSTLDLPEEAPTLESSYSYYTITATYANGDQQIYTLLNGVLLKMGDAEWRPISPALAQDFIGFLNTQQSDDGSYTPPETQNTVETT